MRSGRWRLVLPLATALLPAAAVAAGAPLRRPRPLLLQDASRQNVSQLLIDCEHEVHDLRQLLQACQDNLTAQEARYAAALGGAEGAEHFVAARGAADALQAEVAQRRAQLAQVEHELEALSAQLLDAASAARRLAARASLLHAGARRSLRSAARASWQGRDWIDDVFADMLLECREGEKGVAQSQQLCQANYKAEASRLASRVATRSVITAGAESAAGIAEQQLAILGSQLAAAEGRRDRLRERLQALSEAVAS